MNKFIQVRKYYFAEAVAEADVAACKAGKAPFILTKAAAKAFYAQATLKAKKYNR